MRKFYCDICGRQFMAGHRSGQPHPLAGMMGALIDGLDVCDLCMTELRSRIWEPKILEMIRKEVGTVGTEQ